MKSRYYRAALIFLLGIALGGACQAVFPEWTHGGSMHRHCDLP